jgi:hypothetical protein
MPGSSTTLGRPDARADASDHVAFRLRNSVGAQDANLYEAQWLAYALPYRRFAVALADDRARLRADADRYSFIVSDLHRLLLAGLTGALRKTLDATMANVAAGLGSELEASRPRDSCCSPSIELR